MLDFEREREAEELGHCDVALIILNFGDCDLTPVVTESFHAPSKYGLVDAAELPESSDVVAFCPSEERLGHATINITLDTYSHVVAGLHEDAAEQVAALFRAPVSNPLAGST